MITGKQATVACLVFMGTLWGATAMIGRATASAMASRAEAAEVASVTERPVSGGGGLYAGSGAASQGNSSGGVSLSGEKVSGGPARLWGGVDDKGGSPPGCTTYKFAVRRDTTFYQINCVGTTLPWSK